ncbi:hypothetical protein B4121_2245 [Bacillus paralicheniformis]|uniref:Uncharacterized protein n=1 Tax=Bacillus paralicheniformis TaxID=1648923 RepID=A0A7Z1B3D7_9BACI|nr:hypothetical protein B4121_2245 [Bacillus paralicheniformis]TWK40998.1 hypothetical protein CHCC20348_4421 [Bacillus paralicheniformis]
MAVCADDGSGKKHVSNNRDDVAALIINFFSLLHSFLSKNA